MPTPEDGDLVRAAREKELVERAPQGDLSKKHVPPSSEFEGSRDAMTVWPIVLERVLAKGFTPEQIAIRVVRIPVGPVELKARRGATQELIPLIGSQVAGTDGGQSPAEALYDAILYDYHLAFNAPAVYQLTFQYRFGGSGNIPGVPANCELPLDHPNVLKAQIEARDRREHEAALRAGAVTPMPSRPWRLAYAPPPDRASAPVASPATSSGMVSRETMDEVKTLSSDAAYLRGRIEMEAEMRAKAPPPAAVAAAPQRDPRSPPPGLSEEEWEDIQARREAKRTGAAVVQALTAVGFTPEIMQAIPKLLAQAQTPQAATAPLTPPAPPKTPMEILKDALDVVAEAARFRDKLGVLASGGESGGGDDKEEKEDDPSHMKPITVPGIAMPMAYGEKLEDETWTEYAIRWGTHNPAAAEKFLGWAAKTFDPATLQKLGSTITEAMARRAGAPGGPKALAPSPAAPSTPSAPSQEEPVKTGWQPR